MNKASASKNTRQPSSTKTHKPMPLSLHLARVFKESGLIIVIGFALFMALSVWSYDSGDPGWSHAGSHTKITNMIGFVGAWIADFIVSFIGWVAWLVPIMLLGSSVRFLVRRYVGIIDAIPYFMMRFTGALIFVMGATTLCAIHLSNMHINFPFTAGGLIGHALSDYLIQFFSVYGTTLLAWMMVLFGLTLYMEMSWLAIIEWTGKTLLGLCALFPKILDIQWPTLRLPRFSIPAVKMPQIKAPFVKTSAMNSQKPRDLHNTALNNSPLSDTPFSDTPFSDTPFSDTTRSNTALNNTSSSNRAMYKTPPDRAVVEHSLNKVTVRRMDPVEPTFDLNSFEHEADPFDKAISLTETFAADSSDSPLQTSRNTQLPPASQTRTAAQARPVTTDSVVASPSPSSSLSDRSAEQPLESQQTQTADLMQKTETATKIVSQAPQSVQPEHLATQGATIKGTRVVATQPSKHMRLPSLDLLDKPDPNRIDQGYTDEEMEDMSRLLEAKLNDFGVVAVVEEVSPGPVITRFEIQPAAGVKASKITNLASDLARSMTVSSVRIVEVIPGKSTIGVEIPNQSRQVVYLSQVIDSDPFRKAHSKLTMALGHDISGNPVVTDLAKMPHLLVAGTTGSGKSVGVNAMLVSLLFKAKPDEVRLILVDPKMLELSIYEGIPHLLTPVITDMKEAAGGLRWCVAEMERRYKLMAKLGVRNIAGYNEKVVNADAQGQPIPDPFWRAEDYGLSRDELPPPLTKLPYIVVVIDEFADMMMVVGKKVEELIARIAQKARAAGIHLILATQRPSVDVITGLIKANVPTRMAFQVSSKIDSRTILDQAGAENLLGHGDMLFLPAGTSIPVRVHGAFVSDDDVHRTVEAWKTVAPPNYLDEIVATMSFDEGGSLGADSGGGADDEQDALYDEAVAFVLESRKASISAVQRKLKIGYNRAARMIETMENAGVVSSAGSNGQREVLAPEPHKD